MQSEPAYGRIWLFRLLVNPFNAFAFYFCAVAMFMLVPRSPDAIFAYTLLGPWFVIALLFLTLPFLKAAFERFRMTEAERRNHRAASIARSHRPSLHVCDR